MADTKEAVTCPACKGIAGNPLVDRLCEAHLDEVVRAMTGRRREALTKMVQADQAMGLYDDDGVTQERL